MLIDQLRDLAPENLRVHRKLRYHGDGASIRLESLKPEEAERAVILYGAINAIGDVDSAEAVADNTPLVEQIKAFSRAPLRTAAMSLGKSSDWSDPLLARILHDVRGGALNALTGYSDLDLETEDVQTCVLLARDHAKMMRNAFLDIDPVRRDVDETIRAHALASHLDKWKGRIFPVGERRVRMTVDNHFFGFFSDRCLETSAVDRVVYNLANNAARFALDDKIKLTTFATGPGVMRWVISNRVSADQIAWLENSVGPDLSLLFEGGITRGGNGIGLTSCARFTADAFGLASIERALSEGYLGAVLQGDLFCSWFHWPTYQPDSSDGVCECEH